MTKTMKTACILTVILLSFFLSGCYTVISKTAFTTAHYPRTYDKKVTVTEETVTDDDQYNNTDTENSAEAAEDSEVSANSDSDSTETDNGEVSDTDESNTYITNNYYYDDVPFVSYHPGWRSPWYDPFYDSFWDYCYRPYPSYYSRFSIGLLYDPFYDDPWIYGGGFSCGWWYNSYYPAFPYDYGYFAYTPRYYYPGNQHWYHDGRGDGGNHVRGPRKIREDRLAGFGITGRRSQNIAGDNNTEKMIRTGTRTRDNDKIIRRDRAIGTTGDRRSQETSQTTIEKTSSSSEKSKETVKAQTHQRALSGTTSRRGNNNNISDSKSPSPTSNLTEKNTVTEQQKTRATVRSRDYSAGKERNVKKVQTSERTNSQRRTTTYRIESGTQVNQKSSGEISNRPASPTGTSNNSRETISRSQNVTRRTSPMSSSERRSTSYSTPQSHKVSSSAQSYRGGSSSSSSGRTQSQRTSSSHSGGRRR